MKKNCGNCAIYDRRNNKHSELCGKCITEHFPNGKESTPSMWKPMPQTNADRIRAMNDEELAELLSGVFDEDDYNGKYICGVFIPDYDEIKIKEWLQQPAE